MQINLSFLFPVESSWSKGFPEERSPKTELCSDVGQTGNMEGFTQWRNGGGWSRSELQPDLLTTLPHLLDGFKGQDCETEQELVYAELSYRKWLQTVRWFYSDISNIESEHHVLPQRTDHSTIRSIKSYQDHQGTSGQNVSLTEESDSVQTSSKC